MYEVLVKQKEKYNITNKDMPIQKKSYARYEPLGYTQCVPAESMEVVSENSLGDNGVIQMWKLMTTSYGKLQPFKWAKDTQQPFCAKLNSAIALALSSLESFRNAAMQINDDTTRALAGYALEAYGVLNDDELAIYPMRGASHAQSGNGPHAISINVKKIIDDNEGAESVKTLIHEAFHIIGGGWVEKEYNCNATDINEMLEEMRGKEKAAINADTFAQFVMCYPKP
ncbi:MAG: hypothetical protein J1E65_02470 [Lachnospiraceae bacterium]|nr:hypothetical protein [Lachnospiraceae bacterium]